ncbi:MAG: hypothetical protein LUD29_04625 [Clostridia bacterium]|nr:hypothetical protein [Clostridia bacterium]
MTLARTLFEEVCCKMIELRGETPNKSGNISVLFGQVQRPYFGDVASTAEGKEFEKLLNG